MKKTTWLPLVLGTGLGILAGISLAANIGYTDPSSYSIMVYGIFLLFAFALGGPLSALITVIIAVMAAALGGYPAIKDTYDIYPLLLIVNPLANIIAGVVCGLAYRFVYQRMKMPARLLPWVGIVAAYYIIVIWITEVGTRALIPDAQLMSGFFEILRASSPQMLSDILITSVIWIVLPERYRRPLWYEPKPTAPPAEGMA